MLHEILHTLGFVPTCAPHFTRNGHVSDRATDLMYAGPLPWQPSVLDVGHDDYYATGRTDCLDLAASPFLTPGAAGFGRAGQTAVSGNAARIRLTCTGSTAATCPLTVTLTVSERRLSAARGRKKRKTMKVVVVGDGSLVLSSGQTRLVPVALNRVGRRWLSRRGKLLVSLRVTQTLPSRRTILTRRQLTFELGKRRSRL
ncbi:MAG: hypothetical protein M3Z27_06060 [Actinomycetota bacterium]|nr:hypothetical protein [Actinomycetota bacterium]